MGQLPEAAGDAPEADKIEQPPEMQSMINAEETKAKKSPPLEAVRCRKDIDGGYAWVIMCCAAAQLFVMFFVLNLFGILFVELYEYFNAKKGTIAWIGSCQTATVFLIGPFSNLITQRIGVRQTMMLGGILAAIGQTASCFATDQYFLFFTYGLITGMGLGISHLPAVYSLGLYFEAKRYQMTALSFAIGATAVTFSGPLTNKLIEYFAWRGTLLITAGFCLQIVVAGALNRPIKTDQPKEQLTLKGIFSFHLLKESKMAFYTLNTFLWATSLMIVLVLAIDLAVSKGIPRQKAAWTLTTLGVCTVTVRLVIAAIGHVPHATRWLFNISGVLHGACGVFLLLSNSIIAFHILMGLFGMAYGIKIAVLASLTMEMFGMRYFLAVYGFQMFASGFGGLLGTPFAGWTFDKTGNYLIGFLTSGVTAWLACIMFFIAVHIEKKEHKKRKTIEDMEKAHELGPLSHELLAEQTTQV